MARGRDSRRGGNGIPGWKWGIHRERTIGDTCRGENSRKGLTVRHEDLVFRTVIEARKQNLVFEQRDAFFVVTTKEEDSRGNFFRVGKDELENVRVQLAEPTIRTTFHIDDIWRRVRGYARRQELVERDGDFAKSRLRNICYVLSALGHLTVFKEGKRVFFRKTPTLVHAETERSGA